MWVPCRDDVNAFLADSFECYPGRRQGNFKIPTIELMLKKLFKKNSDDRQVNISGNHHYDVIKFKSSSSSNGFEGLSVKQMKIGFY